MYYSLNDMAQLVPTMLFMQHNSDIHKIYQHALIPVLFWVLKNLVLSKPPPIYT